MKLRLLHLEDNGDDVELVRTALVRQGLDCEILAVDSGPAYLDALQQSHFDAVLSDSSVPGYDGSEALLAARERFPDIPFIVVSAGAGVGMTDKRTAQAATARLTKAELHRLGPALTRAVSQPKSQPEPANSKSPMLQLVEVIQQLSLARDLATIMDIVRRSARALVKADGATFVLRDGDKCFYAEEHAIEPLWKGQRFPLQACVSGWSMLNRQAAVIEDIYRDPRVPHDAYRPTFVKSLVMTPIRTVAPIGAIGVYWAKVHKATAEEIELLRALADSTSIAIEAADVFANLERKVAERTAEVHQRNNELEVLNKELEAFSYSVAHDLRSPLITIDGFAQVLLENLTETLDETNKKHLERITTAVRRMHRLINDLLGLSKIVRAPFHPTTVDLACIAWEVAHGLQEGTPTRIAEFTVAEDMSVQGDYGLLRIVLENLMSNAWKFTSRKERAEIEIGKGCDPSGRTVYFVRDNGAGFDPRFASKLFSPFQRLHPESKFTGTGIGLATVQRIIHRHGGQLWAESAVDCGATFYFTLGDSASSEGSDSAVS
jgi:signal transduction histidine kinase/FixJ family two-component response regulator